MRLTRAVAVKDGADQRFCPWRPVKAICSGIASLYFIVQYVLRLLGSGRNGPLGPQRARSVTIRLVVPNEHAQRPDRGCNHARPAHPAASPPRLPPIPGQYYATHSPAPPPREAWRARIMAEAHEFCGTYPADPSAIRTARHDSRSLQHQGARSERGALLFALRLRCSECYVSRRVLNAYQFGGMHRGFGAGRDRVEFIGIAPQRFRGYMPIVQRGMLTHPC